MTGPQLDDHLRQVHVGLECGHAEVTGPGYRQVVPGSSPPWAAAPTGRLGWDRPPDAAKGEGEG
jgi:hypothetical protein